MYVIFAIIIALILLVLWKLDCALDDFIEDMTEISERSTNFSDSEH